MLANIKLYFYSPQSKITETKKPFTFTNYIKQDENTIPIESRDEFSDQIHAHVIKKLEQSNLNARLLPTIFNRDKFINLLSCDMDMDSYLELQVLDLPMFLIKFIKKDFDEIEDKMILEYLKKDILDENKEYYLKLAIKGTLEQVKNPIPYLFKLKQNKKLDQILEYEINYDTAVFNLSQIKDRQNYISLPNFLIQAPSSGYLEEEIEFQLIDKYNMTMIKTLNLKPILDENIHVIEKELNELLPSSKLISKLLDNKIIYKTQSLIYVTIPLLNGQKVKCSLSIEQEFDIGIIVYEYTKIRYSIKDNIFKPFSHIELLESIPNKDWSEEWFGAEGKRLEELIQSNANKQNNIIYQKPKHTALLALLSGESGIGKTLLIAQLCKVFNIKGYNTNFMKLLIKFKKEKPFLSLIQSIIDDVDFNNYNNGAVLLTIDDCEMIFKKDGNPWMLLNFLDCLKVWQTKVYIKYKVKLIVLFISNQSLLLNDILLGKIDFKFHLEVPNSIQRQHILLHYFNNYNVKFDDLQSIADDCSGYLLADLKLLSKMTLDEIKSNTHNLYETSKECRKKIKLPKIHINDSKIKPVYFKDIAGSQTIKQKLMKFIKYDRKQIDKFQKYNVLPSIGILLYGPPGTGKTLIGKALATETNFNFINLKIPNLIKGEIGASENKLIEYFNLAKASAPSILFLDELDGFFNASNNIHHIRFIKQFLYQLDNLNKFILDSMKPILILSTTNYPNLIDKTILRAGRIDQHIYLAPPNLEARYEMIFNILNKLTIEYNEVYPDVNSLCRMMADIAEGYTGADLNLIQPRCTQLLNSMKKESKDFKLLPEHVLCLIPNSNLNNSYNVIPIIPSVSKDQLKLYEEFCL